MWNTPVARRCRSACVTPFLGLFLTSAAALAQPAPPNPTLATGSSGFLKLGSDLPQPPGALTRMNVNVPISVHKLNWGLVLFRVDACNVAGCSSSASLTPSASRDAIGYVKAATVGSNAQFGRSIALSTNGDTLAVGAFGDSSDEGVVRVFVRNGVTGVPGSTGSINSGAAYLFVPDSTRAWVQTAYLKSPAPDAYDQFGVSVAHGTSGETIAVGAQGEDGSTPGINSNSAANNAASSAGAVYLY